MSRRYEYVGPAEIREQAREQPRGAAIRDLDALREWLHARGQGRVDGLTVTYVIDLDGVLRLADRHSEHIACSRGQAVLAAGELSLRSSGRAFAVEEVSNLSTGFCPEPSCWLAVAAALDRVGLAHPGRFTRAFDFRRCTACGQRNVIKDQWFVCDVCDAPLSDHWNFVS